MKKYQSLEVKIIFMSDDDVVRTSNNSWFDAGDYGGDFPWLSAGGEK